VKVPRTIKQRATDAFGDNSAAEAKDYLGNLSSAWKDVSAALTKQTILLFLLMAAFELLAYQNSNSTAKITVGLLSVSNSSVLLIALPTVVAYLIYDEFRLTARWSDMDYAYTEIYKRFWPKQYSNDLYVLTAPMLPGLWRIGTSASKENAQRSERFIFIVNILVSISAILLFPFAFEIQAFIVLFTRYHVHNAFLWINAAISFGLVAISIVYFCLYSSDPS
jgi:hypothetical protein